jgi:hypothetical protein
MDILSYGYKKPESGDTGSVWYPALEDDIQQLNDHAHNGVNSAPIEGGHIVASSITLAAIDWVNVVADVEWRQVCTLTAPYTYSGTVKEIRLNAASKDLVHPKLEFIDETSFYVYTNDPTASFIVVLK